MHRRRNFRFHRVGAGHPSNRWYQRLLASMSFTAISGCGRTYLVAVQNSLVIGSRIIFLKPASRKADSISANCASISPA